jgi:flagellar assembly factor FliW
MYTMYIAELIDIRIAMILQIPFIFEDYVILVTKVIDVRLLITPFVASNLYCIFKLSQQFSLRATV